MLNIKILWAYTQHCVMEESGHLQQNVVPFCDHGLLTI